MSASANFVPKLVADIYRAYQNGSMQEAFGLQMQLFEVRKVFTLGTYPVMIKEACRLMGIDVGVCRKPLAELSGTDRERLKTALARAGQL